jgi:hypothetical protein
MIGWSKPANSALLWAWWDDSELSTTDKATTQWGEVSKPVIPTVSWLVFELA